MLQKVLIIEDNKAHVEALCKIIRDLQRDMQVYRACNAGEAFRTELEHYIRFAKEVRGISKYCFIPLLFITSLEDPKLHSYSQLHCFGYIENRLVSRRYETLF